MLLALCNMALDYCTISVESIPRPLLRARLIMKQCVIAFGWSLAWSDDGIYLCDSA